MRSVDSHVLNVRQDTDEAFGLVGKDWTVYQNIEVARFAESLVEQGDKVYIETAGTIRNGRKIWFLLRGESFSVRSKEDRIIPYILAANGHDGKTGLHAKNTSIRVVCKNTLAMVIPGLDGLGRSHLIESGFACTHVGDIHSKVEQAREALALYEHARGHQISMLNELALRGVNSEQVKEFFLKAYLNAVGDFKLNPTTEEQQVKKDRAMKFIGKCLHNFEQESSAFGANAWTMLNAFTTTSQSAKRSKSSRESALLFGVDVVRGTKALRLALATAA
jgi:phage/plasmid-like protein (TIGR03299 family)